MYRPSTCAAGRSARRNVSAESDRTAAHPSCRIVCKLTRPIADRSYPRSRRPSGTDSARRAGGSAHYSCPAHGVTLVYCPCPFPASRTSTRGPGPVESPHQPGSKRMQAVLVMFRSDGERRSFSMARDMTVIGRREDCDLRIPLGEVSRKHCRILRDGDSLKLEDLGSSNGTFLNGQRVQEALLSPGDTIQVGPVVFVLQIDGQPSDDELRPVTMDASEAPALIGDDDAAPMESDSLETLTDEEEDAA